MKFFTSLTYATALLAVAGCSDRTGTGPAGAGDADEGGPVSRFDCALDADCGHLADPAAPCRVPRCQPGDRVCALVSVPDGTPCEDGNACTTSDTCATGSCEAGPPLVCDDGNICTADSCSQSAGCTFAANAVACEDENPCTVGDVCAGASCVPGENVCPCTSDGECNGYEDDNLCNGTLYCDLTAAPFTCEVDPLTVVSCDPAADSECAETLCVAATGACEPVFQPDGGACSDGDPCTSGDECLAGACEGPDPRVCSDGVPCTDDSCLAGVGCVALDNGTCGDCVGLDCLPCVFGSSCAAGGTPIGSTCCAKGDALEHLATSYAAEAVDVEVDGTFAYLCGGFGVRISRITNPAAPQYLSSSSSLVQRCQRIGIGPLIGGGGTRVFYLAHHGDSWVPTPFLRTFHLDLATGNASQQDAITSSSTLFEGMAWKDGYLYVAAHGGGLRIYETDAQGIPSFRRAVTGMTNAWKVDVEGDYAYVADGEAGLRVVDISDPSTAVVVQSVATNGLARDVDAFGGRVYVALGGIGADVFDASVPDALTYVATVNGHGSVQAVSADSTILALASWSHVSVFDLASLKLIGTEDLRLYPDFDQVFGVFVAGDLIYAAEWEGLHVVRHNSGYVGSDIWIEEEFLSFDASAPGAHALILRNRGQLDLTISDILVEDPTYFSVDQSSLTIPPGFADVVEVTYTPPGGSGLSLTSRLFIATNDPDSGQNPLEVPVRATETTRLDVGDSIAGEPTFGFLDPSGAGQVEALRGKVLVLAYFALF